MLRQIVSVLWVAFTANCWQHHDKLDFLLKIFGVKMQMDNKQWLQRQK